MKHSIDKINVAQDASKNNTRVAVNQGDVNQNHLLFSTAAALYLIDILSSEITATLPTSGLQNFGGNSLNA